MLDSHNAIPTMVMLGQRFRKFVLFAICAIAAQSASADVQMCSRIMSTSQLVDGGVSPGAAGSCPVTDDFWPRVAPVKMSPKNGGAAVHMYMAVRPVLNRLRVGISAAGDEDVSDADYVVLFFDRNHNSSNWAVGDFAIRLSVSPATTEISSGDMCNLDTFNGAGSGEGTVEYAEYDGTNWIPDPAAAALIDPPKRKHAFDYVSSSVDPETDIWNLEFELPIGSGGKFDLNLAAPSFFAVGGYTFKGVGSLGNPQYEFSEVFRWPEAVYSEKLDALLDPDDVIPEPFRPGVEGGSFDDLAPPQDTLGKVNVGDACFDFYVVRESWTINDIRAEPGDEEVSPGVNTFKFDYAYVGPPGVVPPDNVLPTTGQTKLTLDPYNADGRINSTPLPPNNRAPQTFGMDHPSGEFRVNIPGDLGVSGNINFVCAYPRVDFPLDGDPSNNREHINHNYIETSEKTQDIRLSAEGIPGLKPGESTKMIVKFETLNEAPELSSVAAYRPSFDQGDVKLASFAGFLDLEAQWMLAIGFVVLVAIIIAAFRRRHDINRGVFSIVIFGAGSILIAVTTAGCEIIEEYFDRDTVGTDRWEIENARELGMKAIDGRPAGWFEVPMVFGQTKILKTKFIGQPLKYKTEQMRLDPARGEAPNSVVLPVEPGQVISVHAYGGVDLDGPNGPLPLTAARGFDATRDQPSIGRTEVSPDALRRRVKFFGPNPPLATVRRSSNAGTTAPQADDNRVITVPINTEIIRRQFYAMPTGRYAPAQYAGALAGWFHGDDAQSGAFIVGRHASLIVPPGVDSLTLFVNAQWDQYASATGFFNLYVNRNPAPGHPTRTAGNVDLTHNTPVSIPSWQVLTSLNVYTYYTQAQANPVGPGEIDTIQYWGHAHTSIINSHATEFRLPGNIIIPRGTTDRTGGPQ